MRLHRLRAGWADVCNYALTNSVTGAWFGSYANTESWNAATALNSSIDTIDQSHYYRACWYCEALLWTTQESRATSIPPMSGPQWFRIFRIPG